MALILNPERFRLWDCPYGSQSTAKLERTKCQTSQPPANQKIQYRVCRAYAHDLADDLWEAIETGIDRHENPKTKWVPKDLDEKQLKQFIAQNMRGNG